MSGLVAMWSPKSASASAWRVEVDVVVLARDAVDAHRACRSARGSAPRCPPPSGRSGSGWSRPPRSCAPIPPCRGSPGRWRRGGRSRGRDRRRRPRPCWPTRAAASVILRSETTGPPFWLSPVWSRPRTCRPSSSAAVPRIWFTVTTPVPPMPIMCSGEAVGGHLERGLGQLGVERRAGAAPSSPAGRPARR